MIYKKLTMSKSNSYSSSKPESMTSASREKEPFFGSEGPVGVQTKGEEPFFQPKLSVGQPGDKFEKEADNVADKVVSKKGMDDGPAIQRQEISSIQRLATPIEDENFATNDERMKRDRELREKPEVQTKCSHCEEEEKNAVQKKEGSSPGVASDSLTGRIDSSRGKGSPLPGSTLSEMQSSFGQDFSQVNIHTDAESVEMNRELGAQAFTHGSDIYFNTGKFNPASTTGKHLLAHELTHVVQQGATAGSDHATAESDHATAGSDHTKHTDEPDHSHEAVHSSTTTHTQPGVQRQVTDPIPENKNQFYGHGAFMGAAPQLMADKKWNRILEVLMPDVHAAATKTLSKGPDSPELILQFENNPVMAAYGMYQTKQMDIRKDNDRSDRMAKMEAMEWDVFLPTKIVENFKKAKTEKEKAQLAHDMVNEMIIAHGTPGQTKVENAGPLSKRQYENVKKTPKAEQGGVRPGAWMDLFGKALELATASDWEKKAKEYADPVLNPRVNSPDDQAAHQTFKNQLTFQQVISTYKRVFGKDRFSVLLDIKSRDASPEVLGALVRELNQRGVFVYGVGTFYFKEIEGLNKIKQTVDGQTLSGPKQIKFFHLAGNLQEACLNDSVKHGDIVMFNGGSLIKYDIPLFSKPKQESYAVKTDVVDQLAIYKKHYGFQLGLYVQENDIDDRAATLLTDLTNSRHDIFDLGFAWGGLSGHAASDIKPTMWHAPVGIYNQGWPIGKQWDTSKTGPSLLTIHSLESRIISELTFKEAQHRIEDKNYAGAIAIIIQDLKSTGKVNTALFDWHYIDDPAQGEGLTTTKYRLDPQTQKYLPTGPSELNIYPKAFSSVQWLVSSIMHEYQHVVQQQQPADKLDFIDESKGGRATEVNEAGEVEAYLWELEHLQDTGVKAHPGSTRDLFTRLTDHYNNLGKVNKARQQTYKARYDNAAKLVTPKTKEEEELEKCDAQQPPPDAACKKLYDKVRDRYGNKERNYNFNPDTDVNKAKIRRDDAPVMDSFRTIYNRLDSWDILLKHRLPPAGYDIFDSVFKLNEKRLKWLADLKEATKGYKGDFRDVSHFDVPKTRKDFEQQVLKRIEGEINTLNHDIAGWFKLLTGDPRDVEAIIEWAHKEGTELWRQDWRALILAVNRVISSLWPPARQRIIAWVEQQRKLHPGADLSGDVENIDYVGSLATGYKGAPKQFVRFNVNKFDVDANLDAPPLAKFAMTFDHVKPDRKRIFTIAQGTSITPLIDFAHDAGHMLSAIPGYDVKELFDVVINAPELAEQKRGREGTERIYKLREKLGQAKYNSLVSEIKAAGLLEEGETGWQLRGELTRDEAAQLNKILKKYE